MQKCYIQHSSGVKFTGKKAATKITKLRKDRLQTVVKVTFKLEKDNLFKNLSPFPSWVPPVGHFVSSLISVGSWWDGVIKPTTDRKNRAFVHRFNTLLQQLPKYLIWKKAKLWEKWKQKRGKKLRRVQRNRLTDSTGGAGGSLVFCFFLGSWKTINSTWFWVLGSKDKKIHWDSVWILIC